MPKRPYGKFVKRVKKSLPWIEHLIEDEGAARDLGREIRVLTPRWSPCLLCRGARRLCGKPKCPVMLRFYSLVETRSLVGGEELYGSSPPGLFVGRIGYPYVYIGPLVPPVVGDTSIYDYPELWSNLGIEEIVDFRVKLVRGKTRADARHPERLGRLSDSLVELVLSSRPVDAEVLFAKRPTGSILLDDSVQPMGPSAPVRDLRISGARADRRLERAYYDEDLKAFEAVLELYERGVPVSRIQRGFSAGLFGVKRRRRLVPTRWSITAVDSTISRILRDEVVKGFPPIGEYRVYESEFMGNKFLVIMMPESWSYESIEAWFPGAAWNPSTARVAACGDWEGYRGRTSYAEMGGCYYAARLAVVEHLAREKRQASVLVLREAYPDYLLPLGVWVVREGVRKALASKPVASSDLREILDYVSNRLKLKLDFWIDCSRLLRDAMRQEKITRFL